MTGPPAGESHDFSRVEDVNLSLTDRFRPDDFDAVQGNNKALNQIENWAQNWSPGDPPLLLYGPPGVGKSSTAFVIADTQDWHLHDVNASGARTSEAIADLVQQSRTVPPDGYQLVFIDEIDNLPSSAAIDDLADLLDWPPNPIVLAANDEFDVPDRLRNPCREFEFRLGKRSRKAKLKEIVAAEDFDVSPEEIDSLADRPDLRSAINDLQSSLGTSNTATEVGNDPRHYDENAFEAVRSLLLGETDFDVDETPESFLYWLDENWRADASGLGAGVKDLRGIEIPLAFDALSRSDLFLDHAQRSDYRFWKYASTLQTLTGHLRQTDPYNNNIPIYFPTWYRSSTASPTDETPEAALYRELSNTESGSPGLSGNYHYFRSVVLSLLRDQDQEDLIQLCIDYSLSEQVVEGLGLDPEYVEEWKGGTEWDEHDSTKSVLSDW